MKNTIRIPVLLAAVALAAVGSYAVRATPESAPTPEQRRAAPVRALVAARPFVLERATSHAWRAEQPEYDAGWLVVLEVDPEFVVPRQVEEPVLYAGAETIERVNHGDRCRLVVGILPSARGADGRPALDLASTTFFFGAETLPERVTATEARHELERASRGGARPFGSDEIAAAIARGGDLLHLASRDDLDPVAGVLVLEHCAEDQDVGTGLLAPRVR